jgi:hypothetical protein
MHVDVDAGWKAHSLLRRSNKTQNTLLDYFGSLGEANMFIAFVRGCINRDAVIRHRMEKESVLWGDSALRCSSSNLFTSLQIRHSNFPTAFS